MGVRVEKDARLPSTSGANSSVRSGSSAKQTPFLLFFPRVASSESRRNPCVDRDRALKQGFISLSFFFFFAIDDINNH